MAEIGKPPPTTTLVIMGVSGSGKTTIAKELMRRLGWAYAEGDDFHSPANVEKMRTGHPLTDEDRWPWLRNLLCHGHPSVWFAHVDVSPAVLRARLTARRGHYMPASLLDSQLAALEPLQPDEPGKAVPGDDLPEEVVDHLLDALRRQGRIRPDDVEERP